MTPAEIPALEASLIAAFGAGVRVDRYGSGLVARVHTPDGVWSCATPRGMDMEALSMAEWRHRFADMLSTRSP